MNGVSHEGPCLYTHEQAFFHDLFSVHLKVCTRLMYEYSRAYNVQYTLFDCFIIISACIYIIT